MPTGGCFASGLNIFRARLHTPSAFLESQTMLDNETRLLEARYALHSLELEIEQYRLHIAELTAHPHETERSRAVLEGLLAELTSQRRYCDLLAKADRTGDRTRKNGSRVA